jgi:hypothetical protein
MARQSDGVSDQRSGPYDSLKDRGGYECQIEVRMIWNNKEVCCFYTLLLIEFTLMELVSREVRNFGTPKNELGYV